MISCIIHESNRATANWIINIYILVIENGLERHRQMALKIYTDVIENKDGGGIKYRDFK